MAVILAVGFLYSFFSLIFLLFRALSLPLLLLLAFWVYREWNKKQEQKSLLFEKRSESYLNLKDNVSSMNDSSHKPYLKNNISNKYPFSEWYRGIANTYDNICFYIEKIKDSNLPPTIKNSAESLKSQSVIVMGKLQELEDLGRLRQNNQLLEHSSLKLELIESRLKKLLEDASKDLESVIVDMDIENESRFNDRINAIKENGLRVLQLLDGNDQVTETYFAIKKVLNVRLQEVVDDYKDAKSTGVSGKDSDVIMGEALTHIERIITDAENEIINSKYNNAINNLKANNRYLEKR